MKVAIDQDSDQKVRTSTLGFRLTCLFAGPEAERLRSATHTFAVTQRRVPEPLDPLRHESGQDTLSEVYDEAVRTSERIESNVESTRNGVG